MNWALGLTSGPGGFGSAIQLESGGTHLIGVFDTIARAITAASLAAPDQPPSRAVLVHPSGVSAGELGRQVGDMVLAGIAAADIELRSDAEVLVAVTGNRVLLIDADRDIIAGHPGKTMPFDSDSLAELVARDPFSTTVALTGHPEVRDRYHVASRDYAPMIVERPALAALALSNPTTSALVSTPRTGAVHLNNERRSTPYLFVIAASVVVLVVFLAVFLG